MCSYIYAVLRVLEYWRSPCDAHLVSAGLGKIMQPCFRSLSDWILVRTIFLIFAILRGKLHLEDGFLDNMQEEDSMSSTLHRIRRKRWDILPRELNEHVWRLPPPYVCVSARE